MVYIPNFTVPAEEHKKRSNYHAASAEALKASIETFDLSKIEELDFIVELPDEVPMASNPKWANRRFGAVNTVEKSACVAFVSKMICDYLGVEISMNTLLNVIEINGYRLWKLNQTSKTLNMPEADVSEIKKQFPEEEKMQKCETLEDIYQLYGKPVGIGGSMFFIDNLIKAYNGGSNENTRIQSIEKILENLKVGIPVPIRLENSIYQDDPNMYEGHYVVLYGISKGKAIVADSSYNQKGGIRTLPADALLYAMIGNPKLVCAWDLSSLV